MGGHQYYEFRAIDRPLNASDIKALRALSTRAQITSRSFTNSYQWGDFKGDPAKLMERWFDLHLYFASWGTRCLMIRLPRRLIEQDQVDAFLLDDDTARAWTNGDNLILSIAIDADDLDDQDEWDDEDEWDDGTGWLAELAPLRTALLEGDLRVLYLVWLMAVKADAVAPDQTEPLPGLGPLTAELEAFADFFYIDRDLIAAATEQGARLGVGTSDVDAAPVIGAMTDAEKTEFLRRLFEGDTVVINELRKLVRARLPAAAAQPARTVRELRARADELRQTREQAEAAKALAEQQRQEQAAEQARRKRLAEIELRGERVWAEIEAGIRKRNVKGYDEALVLLGDLKTLATERGTLDDFARRIAELRRRHDQKYTFTERLDRL